MDVHLADERLLVLPHKIGAEEAEARAGVRKVDAFGTLAKMAGLLSRPKDDEFELVYRERRMQPFWRVSCTAVSAYERKRDHVLNFGPEVQQARIAADAYAVSAQKITVPVLETCREETRREVLVDAYTGQAAPDLAGRLGFPAVPATEEQLAEVAREGVVVVPPQTKATAVVRDVMASLINKIEADHVLEETVTFDAVDLYYRPVYAFRYRRQGKEAVVECDGLTGEVRLGGDTFEAYLGKILEPRFLLDVGAEAANLFIPGATLVKVLVFKGMDMKKR